MVFLRIFLIMFQRGFCLGLLYSTLLHLPPLRFHCVGGCRVATFALAERSSNHSARSHPHSTFGQISSTFGQISSLTRLGLIHIRLGRSHPHSARCNPHSARSHPLLGQVSSPFGQISSTFGQISSSLCQVYNDDRRACVLPLSQFLGFPATSTLFRSRSRAHHTTWKNFNYCSFKEPLFPQERSS